MEEEQGGQGCKGRESGDYEGMSVQSHGRAHLMQGPAGVVRRLHLLSEGIGQGGVVFIGSHRLRSLKGWG